MKNKRTPEQLERRRASWRAFQRRANAADPDRVRRHRERARAYRAANPEAVRAADARNRAKNKAAISARQRKYRLANPTRVALSKRGVALKCAYGLTLSDYEAMLRAQDGVCAVNGCRRKADCVDHDHADGKVRALVCRKCNMALGLLGEDPERILGLRDYALAHGCQRLPEKTASGPVQRDTKPVLFDMRQETGHEVTQ